ncbi:23S rRNA (adenine(2503)-C(2))-methyltransferase RlmN [Polyangium sorediatum]|uniref:23S rRNA (Adenine(2503)-C(2))-methyltransferase RlmN n=1 Tax=Polyangium sorediatum TaxID=889274 RepID=A0ABT6NX51_9BACT|nr:23S rRNA (adenine(2503)-C(2))-methyltransferase RlmN [Polyangium sorediatum]MDI1432650.1 23S rRNA (adenine(2503)-C(2))-methyltransferase RlmN [Polyangium sorediatum]
MDVLDKRGGIPLVSRAARGDTLLGSHDANSLAERLVAAGGAPSAARSAAARIVRHAFFRDPAVIPWGPAVFAGLGIGAWAHEALAALDPAPALALHERAPAEDGTIRLLFRARDGALVESVLIPGPGRTTLCISSQVGCARACAFCETGRLGLERQLAAGEIIDQVRLARALWNEAGGAPPLSNLVFMGMGEPFDNLPEVLRALRLLTDDRAFAFAPSRVTVSTVGVADKLPAFFAGTRAELAVSLNAPDDARRRAIMPINARFPLDALRDAILAALPQGRRVLFEYVLFDRWNDAPEDADLLAAYVRGIRCRVNVIPCNPGPDPALRPPTPERLDAFVARLSSHGVTTLVRRPRGRDVGGACGQLAGARRAERERSGATEGA